MPGRHLVSAAPQVDAAQPYVLVDPKLRLEGRDRRLHPRERGQVPLGQAGEQVEISDPGQAGAE